MACTLLSGNNTPTYQVWWQNVQRVERMHKHEIQNITVTLTVKTLFQPFHILHPASWWRTTTPSLTAKRSDNMRLFLFVCSCAFFFTLTMILTSKTASHIFSELLMTMHQGTDVTVGCGSVHGSVNIVRTKPGQAAKWTLTYPPRKLHYGEDWSIADILVQREGQIRTKHNTSSITMDSLVP